MGVVSGKSFWNYLCGDLNYRFFSGVPCKGLKPLYDTMDSEIMYYMPAVDERTALRIASGVALAGDKCGVLMHANSIDSIKKTIKFNALYEVPILFIVYDDRDGLNPYNIIRAEVGLSSGHDFKKTLKKIDSYIIKNKKSKMLIITEGVLK